MTKLRALSAYITAYRNMAYQLNSYRNAREWFEANIPAEQAAAWANAGYLPAEAIEHIKAGTMIHQADGEHVTMIFNRDGTLKHPKY